MRARLAILALAIVLGPMVLAQGSVGAGATPGPALQLSLFADRAVVTTGENLEVRAWVESATVSRVRLEVFHPAQVFSLGAASNVRDVSLPAPGPEVFKFVATRTGKGHVLVRATGTNAAGTPVSVAAHVDNMEVRDRPRPWAPLVSSSLLGVVLGALLTLGSTVLAERRARGRENEQRHRWLRAALPALLEEHRQAVRVEQSARPDIWMDRLLRDGYYAELRVLAAGRVDPGPILIEVAGLLRTYEEARAARRVKQDLRERLDQQLATAIEAVQAL